MITKEQAREHITEMIRGNRASGVPDDGIAAMIAYWMMGHLEGEMKKLQIELDEAYARIAHLDGND